MIRKAWVLLIAALCLTTACSRMPSQAQQPAPRSPEVAQTPPASNSEPAQAQPAPPPSQPAAPPPTSQAAPNPPPGEEGAGLFPAADTQFTCALYEGGSLDRPPVVEEWLRDGHRIVATYNGKPYVTWLLSDTGVWRQDPKGGGQLLRYLPPTLAEQTWKQVSNGAEVWFRLSKKDHFDAGAIWTLTVINRGEKTTYTFIPGYRPGPSQASALNYPNFAASFEKVCDIAKSGALSREQRAAYLAQPQPDPARMAPVVPVTADEFRQALGRLALPVDFDGDGKPESLYPEGDAVRVVNPAGSLLFELKRKQLPDPKIKLYTMPDGRNLVHILWFLGCSPRYDGNLMLWYSAAKQQVVAPTAESWGECGNYQYLGNGAFERSVYDNGTTYVTRYQWTNGELIKQSP